VVDYEKGETYRGGERSLRRRKRKSASCQTRKEIIEKRSLGKRQKSKSCKGAVIKVVEEERQPEYSKKKERKIG